MRTKSGYLQQINCPVTFSNSSKNNPNAMRTCTIPYCDNMCEGRTEYCASHGYEIRRNTKKASQFKVVHQVKKVSAKQAKNIQDYGVLRRQYLSEHDECEVRLPGCDGQATQVHHAAKRGINLLQSDTFLAVCHPCHVYIETKMSAEERRDQGLLITKRETV